jgi:hypothetical protein
MPIETASKEAINNAEGQDLPRGYGERDNIPNRYMVTLEPGYSFQQHEQHINKKAFSADVEKVKTIPQVW